MTPALDGATTVLVMWFTASLAPEMRGLGLMSPEAGARHIELAHVTRFGGGGMVVYHLAGSYRGSVRMLVAAGAPRKSVEPALSVEPCYLV